MSIKLNVKIDEPMRGHIKSFTDSFYKEVVLNAELSCRDIAILFYFYKNRGPKYWWYLRGVFDDCSYSTVTKSLRKLFILGLISRKKGIRGQWVYFLESDLPCQSAKNVAPKI